MTPALAKLAITLLAALTVPSYLIWFGRRSNGWPGRRGTLGQRLAGPLVATFRALAKSPAWGGGNRGAASFVGAAFSVLCSLAALLCLLLGSAVPVSGSPVNLPVALFLSALGLGGTAWSDRASRQDALRGLAWRVVAGGWALHLVTAVALAGVAALAGSWDVERLASGAGATWPYALYQPLGLYLCLSAMLAASPRIPMDALRGANWLLADFHLQHGGPDLALFHYAEQLHLLLTAALVALVYLGGPSGPGPDGLHWVAAKTVVVVLFLAWLRPRYLQRLGGRRPWVAYALLAIANLLLTVVALRVRGS